MQQRGDQRGLTAVRMPNNSYVADLTSVIGLHGLLLERNSKTARPDEEVGAAKTKAGMNTGKSRRSRECVLTGLQPNLPFSGFIPGASRRAGFSHRRKTCVFESYG